MTAPVEPDDLMFDRCRVSPSRHAIWVDGRPGKLGARAFDVLLALIERRDRVVSKNDLLNIVWPNTVVEEGNLLVHIWALRKLLGHPAITTIPGRGYRFTAALTDGQSHTVSPSATAIPSVDSSLTAAQAVPSTKSNLPETLQTLIGREDDMAALGALVAQHRLVTIIGAGGMGKTQVALHLLHQRRGAYEHGVFWVELASLSDPLLIVSTIASALGIQTGSNDPLKGLVAMLKPMKLLLALDNAEHLIDEAARTVQAINQGAPQVYLLITSQVPVKHPGERIYRLGSLALPEHAVAVNEAMTFGAVTLFVERAQSAERHFALTPKNLDAVIAICRHLDGMALAIELAAARVPLLGVTYLAQALDERLRVLTGGSRAAPQRQQTLRAALEWSHGLLSPDEQAVFRRLGVFAGGFSLEMAQRVVTSETGRDPPVDQWAVLDVLGALVDRSLVAVDGAEQPRYRLLESTRAFARERLVVAGEDTEWRHRHAQAVLAQFSLIDTDCWEGRVGVDGAVHALSTELDNGREAFSWSLSHAPSLATAFAPLLVAGLTRSRFHENRRLWEATAELATDKLPIQLRARWARACSAFWIGHKPQVAAEWAGVAVHLSRQLEDPIALYVALASGSQATFPQVGAGQQVAVSELKAMEDPLWPARVKYMGAEAEYVFHVSRGDLDGAKAAAERQLLLAEAADYSEARHGVLANLAELALLSGRVDDAVRFGIELEERLRSTADLLSLAVARVNLSGALLAQGALTQAREMALLGWPLAERFDLQNWWADNLALLAALEGRPRSAACLRGFGDMAYSRNGTTRQANEARAAEFAERIARRQLGDTDFCHYQAMGAALDDEAVVAVAFGVEDV